MAESITIMKSSGGPQTVYLKDYQIPEFLIDEIDLDFQLHENETYVTAKMRVRRHRLSQLRTKKLLLNGDELVLEYVKLDNQLLNQAQYELTDHSLLIFDVPDNFQLEIKTKIYPQKNTALSGLYRSAKTYCTQCEAEGFRRICFFLDHPDILTRYTTTITADAMQFPVLLSNGNLVGAGKLEDGRHWAKWEDPFKKPSYLFALVAGDFDMIEEPFVTQSGREVALRIYVEKGFGDQAHHAMFALKEAMRWDEKNYGREYDLDTYMIVAIGDFNMGAMENKGLNIFNTKYILAKPETATDDDYIHILSVVAHEYFHNWSGNRVTCRDWFQLSLKEGLTIFRDQSFSEDTISAAVMRIRDVNDLREVQFPEDNGPLAHPVLPDSYIEINNFYTATIYNKGAELLRMLRTILGKSMFRKGMDLYFARHDGQAVTIEDYIKTMEDVSGVDLTQFRLWYKQTGTPLLTIKDHYDAEQKVYSLMVQQSYPSVLNDTVKHPLHIPIRMGLLDQAGNDIPLECDDGPVETEKVLHLHGASHVFRFNHVKTKPVPSLLRYFSAPVKLDFPYSDADLIFLLKHDKDPFNRWDAGQQYVMRLLLRLVDTVRQQKNKIFPSDLAAVYSHLLNTDIKDPFLLAEMLNLPSEKYIGEQMPVVDVFAIHEAREFVLDNMAAHLEADLLNIYHRYQAANALHPFNVEQVGKRQLKNRCLSYLMHLPKYAELGLKQFQTAIHSNMTDTLAALQALSRIDSSIRSQVLDQFYTTWQEDALVIDKWFAIQAASPLPDTLEQVKKLMEHPAFDIKNPNKVYALIGTFGHRNHIHFHAKQGEGYVFLRETVEILDPLNPQVAARMIKPLTTWQRYDKQRQTLMREQLEWLLRNRKLSPDTYELVIKSLE